MDDKLSLKGAWSLSRDFFKFWKIIDNIQEMVQDSDMVIMEGLIGYHVWLIEWHDCQ